MELEIQVLPGNMDKAWIPDFIESKLKEALTFSVSRHLLAAPQPGGAGGTAQEAAQGWAGCTVQPCNALAHCLLP